MASVTTRAQWGKSGVGLAVGMLLVMALSASSAEAQLGGFFPSAKPKASALLQKGRDAFAQGEFDKAAGFYQQAQSQSQQLSDQEKTDLQNLVQQNDTALKSRQAGRDQLKQARAALDKGMDSQAAQLLQVVGTNQYLSPADKQQADELNYRLKNGKMPPPGTILGDPAAGKDFRTLLKDARTALKNNNFDLAEYLAREAEKQNKGNLPSFLHPWDDTPVQVLRAVKTARAAAEPNGKAPGKNNPVVVQNNPTSPDGKKPSAGPPTQLPDPTGANPGLPMPSGPKQIDVVKTGFQAPASAGTPESDSARRDQARQLIKDGYKALNKGDVAQARKLAEQARGLNVAWNFWEDTPERLIADIDRQQASAGHVPTPVANQPAAKANPHELLRQGREMLKKGDLDEAERLCNQADNVQGTRWSLFDNPNMLRGEIKGERARQNHKKATEILAQARQAFADKKFQDAEALSYKAEKLWGPYSILDRGDRPDWLRKEIQTARSTQQKVDVPLPPDLKGPPPPPVPGLDVAKNPPPPPDFKLPPAPPQPIAKTPPPLTTEQQLARQKAVELTRQAIALQKQNKLVEARAQALQAQQAAIGARKLGVTFAPTDEDPDTVLMQLSVQCRQQIGTLLAQVEKTGSSKAAGSFEAAVGCLDQAKQLALAFGLPQQDIEAKVMWLGQMQMGQGGLPSPGLPPELTKLAPPPPPTPLNDDQKQGLRLVDDAWRELKKGQTLLAQKIAEEALNPRYNVQKQASEVLRAVSMEKMEQNRLAAVRNVEAVRDALILKKVDQARNIAALIDVGLLPPDKLRDYQDLMSMPEMQASASPPSPIAQAPVLEPGSGNPKVKIHISDSGPGSSPTTDVGPPGFADNLKAMESVLFDKYKSESVTVRIKAQDVFKAGDYDRALDILKGYNEQLEEAKLSPLHLKQLRQPIEQSIKNYSQLKAQLEWQKMAQQAQKSPFEPERVRLEKERNRDNQIASLVKEAGELFKEKKYQECLMRASQAHDLDPDNGAVTALMNMAITARNRDTFWKNEHQKEDFIIDELNMDYSNIPNSKRPVTLDRELLNHGKKRNAPDHYRMDHLSPIEKQIESKLEAPITLRFKDTPLKQAIQDLRYLSGLNVVPDKSAMEEHGISMDAPITLEVENIPMKSALNLLLKQVNLTYMIKDNVLQVTTHENTSGKLVSVTYPVGDLVLPPMTTPQKAMPGLEDLLRSPNGPQAYGGPMPYTGPNMLGGASPVSSYNGGSPGSGFAQNAPAGSQGGGNWNTTRAMPKQTIEDQLIRLITGSISPESWSEVGGKGTIHYFPTGMGLIVNQTQDIQEQVADLLAALRRLQDLEVAIEIRLVAVSESFFEYMGVNWDINIETHNTRYQPQLIGQQFAPFGYVNKFVPNNFVAGLTPAGTFTPDLNVPLKDSSFGYALPPAGLGGFPGVLGADGGISLGLAFLSDIQVFMFMEASQGDKRANSMQAPRVTVFNGQQATMSVQDTLPFLTNITPQFGAQGEFLFFTPQQIPLPLGTNIIVQPVVTADRRFVRLSITQTMQNLVATNVPLIPIQIPFFDALYGQQAASNQAKVFQVFLQQPATSSITVNTTVTVPDGGTVLLGGLKTLTEQRNEYGPPILSKIPYINRLFKNVGYGREATSLLMMVTPRIIINEEEELIYLEQLPAIPRP